MLFGSVGLGDWGCFNELAWPKLRALMMRLPRFAPLEWAEVS